MLINATLIVIHVTVSFILIVFILLHSGRGGGLSDMFGGAAGGSMAGSTVVEKNLDRLTVVCRSGLHVHDDAALPSPLTELRFMSREARNVPAGSTDVPSVPCDIQLPGRSRESSAHSPVRSLALLIVLSLVLAACGSSV